MASNGTTELSQAELKQKCRDMKQKILKVEDLNKTAAIEIKRTKTSINRLRLEYSILLERLEQRSSIEETSDLSDSQNFEISDKKIPKKKKMFVSKDSVKDPDLPKKPLNPYLIFCDLEKEKYRAETGTRMADHSKILGEAWKNLGEEGRQRYVDIYNQDKERYNKEMELYGNNSAKRLKANDGKSITPITEKSTDDDIVKQEDNEQTEELTHKEPHSEETSFVNNQTTSNVTSINSIIDNLASAADETTVTNNDTNVKSTEVKTE